MTTDDNKTSELTAWHHDLAKLLAAGMSYTAAGEQLGASKSTIARAIRDPKMRRLVETQRQHNVDALLGKNLPEAERSIEFLALVRDDEKASESARLKAACELLMSASRLGRFVESRPLTGDEARAWLIREVHAIDDGRKPPNNDEGRPV